MKKLLFTSLPVVLLTGCVAVPVPTSHSMMPGYNNNGQTVANNQLPDNLSPAIPTTTSAPGQPVAASTGNAIPIPVATAIVSYTPVNVPVLQPASQSSTQTPTISKAVATTTLPTNNHSTRALQDLNWVAKKIYSNQLSNDPTQLVKWNEVGNFAVLGINQLIWYPANKSGSFSETFPAYVEFAKANNVPVPAWIAQRPSRGGPWADAAAFQRASNDPQMRELRGFMAKTLNVQANFMINRLQQRMPTMVNSLPASDRQRVMTNFQRLAQSPGGIYPLLDYLQFKGDGMNPAQRYNGQGWGLLQVLQSMQETSAGPAALAEFRRAADDTLVQRIANAPSDKREARLLNDWLKRINTYQTNTTASR